MPWSSFVLWINPSWLKYLLTVPWFRLEINQPIVKVESEKITVTLESEKSGLVDEILVEEGETVKTGTVVCRIKEK